LVFENFESYNNREDGVLSEYVGDVLYRNFKVAGMARAGAQIHKANITHKNVIMENFLVVGLTPWNKTSSASADADILLHQNA